MLGRLIHVCTSVSSSVKWADGAALPVLQSYPERKGAWKSARVTV